MRRGEWGLGIWILVWAVIPWTGSAAGPETDDSDTLILQSPSPGASANSIRQPTYAQQPHYHWAFGVSYTGAQVRYALSSRWAAEGRLQFGSADSHYGAVHSDVFGLRGYRFFSLRHSGHFVGYWGGEGDYAKAESRSSSYATKGMTAGAFGGLEYRVSPRVFIGVDIGPYVISLKETQTQTSSTGLDFVVNTGVNVFLF